MNRSDIDRAVVELDGYLKVASTPESAFQGWAEKHAVVFAALGYRQVIPHPRLHTPDGELFVPDFICMTNNGIWEIVELKTAEPAIYKDKDRRATFYQPMAECIAQCNDYSRWLSAQPAKGEFEAMYGGALSDRPGALIIAGGTSDYDRQAVASNLGSRTPQMRLLTWRDVLNLMLQFRASVFGAVDEAMGCALLTSIRIDQQPTDGQLTLVDVGADQGSNRLTISVSNRDGLHLRVLLANGTEQRITVAPRDDGFNFGRALLLELEVASTSRGVRIGLDINHHEAAALQLALGTFGLASPFCLTLGTGMDGGPGAAFRMFGESARSGPFSPLDAAEITRFLELLPKMQDTLVLEFSPGAFLYTQGHPLFDPASGQTSHLVQHRDELRPRLGPNPEFGHAP